MNMTMLLATIPSHGETKGDGKTERELPPAKEETIRVTDENVDEMDRQLLELHGLL
jgi:hypothetical protein